MLPCRYGCHTVFGSGEESREAIRKTRWRQTASTCRIAAENINLGAEVSIRGERPTRIVSWVFLIGPLASDEKKLGGPNQHSVSVDPKRGCSGRNETMGRGHAQDRSSHLSAAPRGCTSGTVAAAGLAAPCTASASWPRGSATWPPCTYSVSPAREKDKRGTNKTNTQATTRHPCKRREGKSKNHLFVHRSMKAG